MTIEGTPTFSDDTYKKYALSQLKNWIHDAISFDDATPQEVYDVILEAAQEDLDFYRKRIDNLTKFISLLKGHRCLEIDLSDILPDYNDLEETQGDKVIISDCQC